MGGNSQTTDAACEPFCIRNGTNTLGIFDLLQTSAVVDRTNSMATITADFEFFSANEAGTSGAESLKCLRIVAVRDCRGAHKKQGKACTD
mmetsp:Transcript_14609/g.40207  ORF Transcript_14609/g.40207 Transcript_14609/m.40207 type:complete len:90 (+) Transcript_14609:1389-1658(+)